MQPRGDKKKNVWGGIDGDIFMGIVGLQNEWEEAKMPALDQRPLKTFLTQGPELQKEIAV